MKHIKPYKLFEFRKQLNIPFKEPKYRGKSVHEHIEDALIDLQVMKFDQYHSKGNPEDEIDKMIPVAIDNVMVNEDDTTLNDYMYGVAYKYRIVEDGKRNPDKIYNGKFLSKFWKDKELDRDYKYYEENYDDFVGDFVDYVHGEIKHAKEVFSKEGWSLFMDMAENDVNESIYDMRTAIEESYKKDKKGLIDVWRMVDYEKEDTKDIYLAITKNYGGVGVYWTWDENSAEAYWGSRTENKNKKHTLTLHGKASVDNIDWEETVYKNVYYLKEEKEVRIKNGGAIMIVGFHDEEINKYHEFETPYVVKVGR